MTGGGAARTGWDFFVSYTQADQAWAEWIAWQLEADGHQVLVQAWDMVPGANWVHRMHEGVQRAERTVAVLSPAYLTSVYGTAESEAAWQRDPLGEERTLIVVRVADCERPGLLSGVVSVDLFGLSKATARQTLRTAVQGAVMGRAKPAAEPVFPAEGRAVPGEPRFPGALPEVWNVPARNPNAAARHLYLTAVASRVLEIPWVEASRVAAGAQDGQDGGPVFAHLSELPAADLARRLAGELHNGQDGAARWCSVVLLSRLSTQVGSAVRDAFQQAIAREPGRETLRSIGLALAGDNPTTS